MSREHLHVLNDPCFSPKQRSVVVLGSARGGLFGIHEAWPSLPDELLHATHRIVQPGV
jgi:hypothetical protein